MPKWIGRRQSVGLGVESTRGTSVSASYWYNVLSWSHFDVPQRARSNASFGEISEGDVAPVVQNHAEGEMEIEVGDVSIGVILKALLGTETVTGPVDSAYTHTYSLQNDNVHDSLTIITVDPIGTFRFSRAMIDSLTLNITKDSIVSTVVRFLSNPAQEYSPATKTYSKENKFIGRGLNFDIATTTAALSSSTPTKVRSLTLTFEKNAEIRAVLSTIHPEDIVNKLFTIRGEIEVDYEDRTYLDLVRDGSYKAIRVELVGTTLITGSTATFPAFKIDLSKVDFENWAGDFPNDDVVTQTLEFFALYDVGGQDNVINSCTLINELATVY